MDSRTIVFNFFRSVWIALSNQLKN